MARSAFISWGRASAGSWACEVEIAGILRLLNRRRRSGVLREDSPLLRHVHSRPCLVQHIYLRAELPRKVLIFSNPSYRIQAPTMETQGKRPVSSHRPAQKPMSVLVHTKSGLGLKTTSSGSPPPTLKTHVPLAIAVTMVSGSRRKDGMCPSYWTCPTLCGRHWPRAGG